jgi:putative tricarboxylic transport membrane protein
MAEKTAGFSVSVKMVEVVTALVIFFLGCLVIYDSLRAGNGWASDGPQAGFYPFYVGIFLCCAALAILAQQLFFHPKAKVFADGAQLKNVLAILLPSMIYVAAIYLVGIYVASALFLAIFMLWQGKYSLQKAIPFSLLVPAFLFLLFEIWFKVPLPKGPLEALFGY